MKKTILTLAISILCLGLASFLFSLEKDSNKTSHQASTSLINVEPAKLPSAKDIFLTTSLNPNFIPVRDWSIKEPEIKARAGVVFDWNGEKFLYQKNIKNKLPIASLTKIMTAIVALENLGLEDIITISRKAVMTEGENGRLIISEKLSVRNLIYIMLIESSNDAAVALADAVDDDFVALMNKKAKEIGLENTHFVDATGISKWNYSTIFDLTQLAKYSFNKSFTSSEAGLIWQILGIREIEIRSEDKEISHNLVNTNKLLDEIPEMIGGKTGFTNEAGNCMLTIVEIPEKPGKYLITVILGTEDRELETKKLIEWAQKAYIW